MRNTPEDPSNYFADYASQIRARSGRQARGIEDSRTQAAFDVPDYYARVQPSSITGASFVVGLPDPLVTAQSQTFGTLFQRTPALQQSLARQMIDHVNLEGPSGQATKERLNLPYQEHSIVDLKAALKFVQTTAKKVFTGNQFDGWARAGLDYVHEIPVFQDTLEIFDKVAGNFNNRAGEKIRGSKLAPYFQNLADNSVERFSTLGDLGQGYANFSRAVARPLGFESTGKELFKVTDQRILKYAAAPAALLALNIMPLSSEVKHLWDKATGNKEARERAEEHHNLESPTGRIIKSTLGLPYKKHSTVDEIESAFAHHLLPRMSQLDLRKGEYIIGGSGALFEHGIKPNDVDLRVNKTGWGRLLSQGHVPTDHGNWQSLELGDIQIWGPGGHGAEHSAKDIIRAVDMHGLSFQRQDVSLALKEKLARPKDLAHIRQAGYQISSDTHSTLNSYGYEYQNGIAVPQHQNLEDANAPHLRSLVGSHYKDHSEPDALGAANNFLGGAWKHTNDAVNAVTHYDPFKDVRAYFDKLGEQHVNLVGRPREIMRSLYQMESSALEYFATHNNILLSTIARSLLYGERITHLYDYTFKLSPTRFVSRLLRAVAGIEKRDYEHLAFSGIAGAAEFQGEYDKYLLKGGAEKTGKAYEALINHEKRVALSATDETVAKALAKELLSRRIVKAAGIIIGGTEIVLHGLHAVAELKELKDRYTGTGDNQHGRQKDLDKTRRRQLKDARRRGEKYDPTRPGREDDGDKKPWVHDVFEELVTQFSIKGHLRAVKETITDPKHHLASVGMYATFLGLTGVALNKALVETTATKTLGKRASQVLGKLSEYHGIRLQYAAAAFSIGGILTGRTAAGRAGSAANFIAIFTSDQIGKRVGNYALHTPVGMRAAAKGYSFLAFVPKYFEITNSNVISWADQQTKASNALMKAVTDKASLTEAEEALVGTARVVAERLGMEVVGIGLEGTLLIPLRHAFRNFGRSIDRRNHIRRAERRAGKEEKRTKTPKQTDIWLKRYLLASSAQAYSQKDILLSPDYTQRQKVLLLAARRNESTAKMLDDVGKIITPIRKARAAAMALFTTHRGRHPKESWANQLARAYAAPAYSDGDIASNPQYTVPERLALARMKRSGKGQKILDRISPYVTRKRQVVAAAGMAFHRDVDGLKAHVHHVARKHAHKGAQAASDAVKGIPGGAVALDVLNKAHGAVDAAAEAVHVDRKSPKTKVKIRSTARSRNAPLDEKMLHTAYSRQINYGSSGNSISYNSQNS